jgi:hypothetical protein
MSIGRLFEIEGVQPFETLTGNEKSFFEMASKLPEPFDPNPVGDPWPIEVLMAEGFSAEKIERYLATFPPDKRYPIVDKEGNELPRIEGFRRRRQRKDDGLPEVPNISSFGPRPDLFPDQGGNGTHFDESRFIHMVLNKDWKEVSEYLTEVLTGWEKFDFPQQQVHWDRVLLLSKDDGFPERIQGSIGICLNTIRIMRSHGE